MTKKDKARTSDKAGDKSADRPGRAWAISLETRLQALEAVIVGATPGHAAAGDVTAQGFDQDASGPSGAKSDRIRVSVRMGDTDWRLDAPGTSLTGGDWAVLAPRLAALGHPARLAILRAVLGGACETAALMQAAGASTSGQLYHHLRELMAAGWLTAPRRGVYTIPADRVGPLLAAAALMRG